MYISGNDVIMTTWNNEKVRIDIRDIKDVIPVIGCHGQGISITTRTGTFVGAGSHEDYRKIQDKLWGF